MLALSASRDGGLMIDLSRYAPFDSYRYGVLDVPAGVGEVEALLREQEGSWARDGLAPKIHFHPSGYLSVDATHQLERQAISIAPPAEIGLGHRHAFSFQAKNPFAWRKVPRRDSDLVFIPSRPPPTITIAGHLGPAANLVQSELPGNPFSAMVENDDGNYVPTVVAQLKAAAYYAWIEVHPDREFGSGDAPCVVFVAFDPVRAVNVTEPTEMVGVWSAP